MTGRLRRGHALAPRTVAAGDGQLLTGATLGVAAGQGTIRWLAALIVVLAASGASPAEAQCRVRTESAVAFGTYSVFATAPLDTTGRISWRCQGATPVPVQITVSRGNHPSGTARRLAGSSDFLRYELYLNSGRTSVWGDGTYGSPYSGTYPGSGWVQVWIFARIFELQDVGGGTYTDDVTVVINF